VRLLETLGWMAEVASSESICAEVPHWPPIWAHLLCSKAGWDEMAQRRPTCLQCRSCLRFEADCSIRCLGLNRSPLVKRRLIGRRAR